MIRSRDAAAINVRLQFSKKKIQKKSMSRIHNLNDTEGERSLLAEEASFGPNFGDAWKNWK
jgi:hypothetical protein